MPRRPNRTEEVELWRQRIERAEAKLRKEQQRWQETLASYRGVNYPEAETRVDRQGVNLVYAITRRLIPRVYFRDPDTNPIPRIDDPAVAEMAITTMRAYMRQLFRRLRVGKEIRRVILDALLMNRGWMKVGYQAEFEETADRKEQFGASMPAFPEEVTLAERRAVLKEFGLRPDEVEFDDRLISEKVFAKRIRPDYVLVDPDAGTEDDAAWLVHKVPKRLDHLKNSRIYRADQTRWLEGMILSEDVFGENDIAQYPPTTSALVNVANEKTEWTTIYEIWDREAGELKVLGKQGEDFLKDVEDWPYEMNEFPLLSLQLNEDPSRFWGQSMAEVWLPLIMEINDYRKKRMSRVNRNISKIVAVKPEFNEAALELLDNDVDQQVVPVETTDRSVRDLITRLDPAGTPPDLNVAEARAMEMLSNVSGISEQRRGVASPYQSATEASIIEKAVQEVEADVLGEVETFIGKTADCLLKLTRQFIEEPEIVRETGLVGFKFYKVTPEMRRFSYDIEIMPGSTRYVSTQQMIQNHSTFLQMVAPFQAGDIVYLLRQIGRLLDIPNSDAVVLDPSDPQNLRRMILLAEARRILGTDFESAVLKSLGGAGGNGTGLAGQAESGMAQGGSEPRTARSVEENAEQVAVP